MEQETKGLEVIPADKAKIKKIWTVTLYLAIATIIEFIIAFTIDAGFLKTSIFIILTIFKAFYIVGEFMHLSHEKKGLIWSIVAPLIFIVWMLVAFMIQGDAIYSMVFGG